MTPHAAQSTPEPDDTIPADADPAFLTVEEAAEVLRIGRTAAYALTRRWRATDGGEGLPVVRVGRLLRVPRRELERLAAGSIRSVPAPEPSAPEPDPPPAKSPLPKRPKTRTRTPSTESVTQESLFPEAS